MSTLVNPFTRQVINVNPGGCNQYTGKGCTGAQAAEAIDSMDMSGHLPIDVLYKELKSRLPRGTTKQEFQAAMIELSRSEDYEGNIGLPSGRKISLPPASTAARHKGTFHSEDDRGVRFYHYVKAE